MEDVDTGDSSSVPNTPMALLAAAAASAVAAPRHLLGRQVGRGTGGLLLEKLPHGAQGRASVLPPKVVPVVQVVKELVEQLPPVKPWSLGDLLVVGSEEGPGEATEHQGNCQFKLRMAVEGSRVVNKGARVVLGHVS